MNNNRYVRIIKGLFIVAVVLSISFIYNNSEVGAEETSVDCTSLCKAAVKVADNADKLKYKSQLALDFGALSSSDRKKVDEIFYLCDKKEAYSIAIINSKNAKDAKALYKSLKTYKNNNCKSDYLGDYTSAEQKVFKNAIVGKKGTYVWYIAISEKKNNNNKCSKAIKKNI